MTSQKVAILLSADLC